MKVKEFIACLSKIDQDADLSFRFGSNDTYRKACARLAMEDDGTDKNDGLGCLKFLRVDTIKQTQYIEGTESDVIITLEQNYYQDSFFNKRFADEFKKA